MPATLTSNVVLTNGLNQLWDAAISARTRTTYASGFNCLCNFLIMHAVFSTYANSLPYINEEILMYFVAHCFAVLKLRHTTVKTYLAGIKFTYMAAGVHCVFDDAARGSLNRLYTILRGYKKLASPVVRVRLPITFSLLRRLLLLLRRGVFGPFEDLILECMCTTAFFGFLRCSEFTSISHFVPDTDLCINDILFDYSGRCVKLRLKESKTDPFRCGVYIPLFATDQDICPFRNLDMVIRLRRQSNATDFDPVFVTLEGRPFTRSIFLRRLDTLLMRLGLDCSMYNGHSFRIGAATTAASVRMEEHLIRTLGRWSSDCYMRYIQTPNSVIADAQGSLCHLSL